MTASILVTAQQRGIDNSLPYAGAVTPEEAFELIQKDEKIILIDVRTHAERDWVGRVVIPEAQHHAIQWTQYPGATPNNDFIQQLQDIAPNKDTIILFLCRSGVRSRHGAKAATENGYSQCFDILQGFEGDKDTHGHRKTVGGWCSAALPWMGA